MSRSVLLSSLLGSVAVAVTVAAPHAAAAAPEAARIAACDFGHEVGTYDYRDDLDGYFQRVLDRSTGKFRQEFADASTALKDAMTAAQSTSWVDGLTCGSVRGDFLSAEILVTYTQRRTNHSGPSDQHLVINVFLKNEWGRWLVDELDSPMLK
ncbi:hypothetical protein [Nocardia camponoti]|uniref:Mce-associated membrane protein n=1 Tax=Nocardia camponoti TaxID=1616106 RepID=A0A917QUR3_9NOCA|nr:hypothetical protein [Nocardia camponoti]GGK68307.1 hypothetical protein GCM10011591_45540 [Nocardia camponoti]